MISPTAGLAIGMNARLFPGNWRPACQEIAFARSAGFTAIQFHGRQQGLDETVLGAPLAMVAAALRDAGLAPVLELVTPISQRGLTPTGLTPLEFLQVNLPAINGLGCAHVHLHLTLGSELAAPAIAELEEALLPQFRTAVDLARIHGFRLGFEHNEPRIGLLATPERCAWLLAALPDLGFVWDINHTIPAHLEGFLELAGRMTMLHISDTPLPTVNSHLPLGMGSIDLAGYCAALRERGFAGPAILEIGGLPQSGGYGRDTDAALLDSGQRLALAWAG